MADTRTEFLQAVLGAEGAQALLKACGREPGLSDILIPRVIFGWIQALSDFGGYQGQLPGRSEIEVDFRKSETGLFKGSLKLEDGLYVFGSAPSYHVAAVVAKSLGIEALEVSDELRDAVLTRLGKTVDALIKGQLLVSEIRSRASQAIQKTDRPGMTAKPQEHLEALEPQAPSRAGGKQAQRPPRIPSISLTKDELRTRCQICGGQQFRDSIFRGCACLQDLAKAVRTTVYKDGVVLDWGQEVSRDEVQTLLRAFKGEGHD